MQIVRALQSRGRHVAMIGDGVNDVLPIKTADLGIAMGEGSQASKTVAGLVLENNDFALLPGDARRGPDHRPQSPPLGASSSSSRTSTRSP